MKVKTSMLLANVKPLLKELLELLLKKYTYVSILAEDGISKQYNVSSSGTQIYEDDFLASKGFVVKIYDGRAYLEYSFNEISTDLIPNIISDIDTKLSEVKKFLPDGVNSSEYPVPEDEKLVFSKSTEYEIDPVELGNQKIIETLTDIRQKCLSIDERILDAYASMYYQQYTKIFMSRNKDMEQNVLWTCGFLEAMSSRGEEIKQNAQVYSILGGAELLSQLSKDIEKVANTAIALLDSESITPGTYDCICTPEVTGMIVHEAFGHGVEMDMFVKNRALAKEYINKYVASEIVSMHDGASACKEVASYFFDDEGIIAQDTLIIDKGILKQGICDMQSASVLNTKPTGNGRRESFERKAYTRMTNTFFEPGHDKLEDMIKSIEYGFLLQNASSGMEDPKNWGIQCMVDIAREIKNGEFTGKIYSPIVLTGYVPDLLKSISMISDDLSFEGGGFCGKGYKEWVKVSDGGPYIKAKIRLG